MKNLNCCCLNSSCGLNCVNVTVESENFQTEEVCEGCGSLLKVLGERSAVFLGTSLLNQEQKRNMLLKRSREHSKTSELKDRREYLSRTADSELKSI